MLSTVIYQCRYCSYASKLLHYYIFITKHITWVDTVKGDLKDWNAYNYLEHMKLSNPCDQTMRYVGQWPTTPIICFSYIHAFTILCSEVDLGREISIYPAQARKASPFCLLITSLDAHLVVIRHQMPCHLAFTTLNLKQQW